MPSFDVSSDVDWQEVDNAVNQTVKEIGQRFDFRGVKTEVTFDKKLKTILLWASVPEKLDAVEDTLHNKLIKRGISLLSLEKLPQEDGFGGSARVTIKIQAGVSKEKGKEIMATLKDSKLKVQGQIQDEKVRVTGKSRDDLQGAIQYLKGKQDELKIPMQFGNFRD